MSRCTALLPALAALLLTTTGCALVDEALDDPKPPPAVSASPAVDEGALDGSADGLPLADAIAQLVVEPEHTGGYQRDSFRHWTGGDDPDDGCDTRGELLLAEAVKPPTKEAGCTLVGGEWFSYYDEVTVTDASKLDVDHMIPLEEAWSSGAHAWDAERRTAFANDLAAPRSLVAVTAKTNRSKGARDVAEWLPPAESALCTYLEDWTTTKLRWELTADETEHAALERLAPQCPDSTVTVIPAP
ncbi:HNH endonuclease family protein [Streptomyces sp. AD55]|uniref:HNH endonuclease family protein n=1 Tax=Streptomyces sp. AD55 TaxID=3242895 RepID=UPI0035296ED3